MISQLCWFSLSLVNKPTLLVLCARTLQWSDNTFLNISRSLLCPRNKHQWGQMEFRGEGRILAASRGWPTVGFHANSLWRSDVWKCYDPSFWHWTWYAYADYINQNNCLQTFLFVPNMGTLCTRHCCPSEMWPLKCSFVLRMTGMHQPQLAQHLRVKMATFSQHSLAIHNV